MLYWRLAFRNLLRHRGRLILNLILLVGAFSAIVCFKGFTTNVLETIKGLLIDTQFGHVQVAKKSFWDNSPVEQATDKMISAPMDLAKKISGIEGVQFASPRVAFYGLVNTESKSVTARFIGIQPDIEFRMQKGLLFVEGSELERSKQIILSTGLKTKLQVKSADDLTVVSPTLSGGINAMDLNISGIFSTGFAEIDNGTVYLTFPDAQKVLDSDYADQLIITLKDEATGPQVIDEMRQLLQGTDLLVKPWRELADLYIQVETFYTFQNLFIEIIFLLLLFLSAANTITMNVFERLSEIGTLRALGDYESDIQRLFLIEALLLGLLAVGIGIPFSLILIKFISSLQIQVSLPMASRPIPLKLIPSWGAYLEASSVCVFSVVVASLWPARKSAKISIVSALGARL